MVSENSENQKKQRNLYFREITSWRKICVIMKTGPKAGPHTGNQTELTKITNNGNSDSQV